MKSIKELELEVGIKDKNRPSLVTMGTPNTEPNELPVDPYWIGRIVAEMATKVKEFGETPISIIIDSKEDKNGAIYFEEGTTKEQALAIFKKINNERGIKR